MEIEQLLRENIKKLTPYSCARDEYSGQQAVFLDANENPYETGYNRYPDPYQRVLKAEIARLKGVDVKHILLGNGSDEIIDLLIRTVCEPTLDHIVVFSPGYAMYEVSAAINNVEVRKINLRPDCLPDWEQMWQQTNKHTKLIFLCSPNNPTGKVIPFEQIREVVRRSEGLVVVDEAYIDFTEERSAVELLKTYPNVVVMQTLSKAWGMAGLRLGMCFADERLIRVLNKVKAPYNISGLTQAVVLEELGRYERFLQRLAEIKAERQRLLKALRSLTYLERVYDSEANFILVTSEYFREIYELLINRQVVVRMRDIPPVAARGLRISVGTKAENDRLLEVLQSFKPENKRRR